MGPEKFCKDVLFPFMEREEGRGFAMETIISSALTPGKEIYFDAVRRKVPICGTVACILGSIELLVNTTNLRSMGKLLGLDYDDASTLFNGWDIEGGWPKKYAQKYENATTAWEKFLIAKKVTELAVRTGGVCFHERD